MKKLINSIALAFVAGRLAVKDDKDENTTIYVVWGADTETLTVKLVELDRPNDGNNHTVNILEEDVYVLEPLEVLERVTEWK